MARSGEQMRNTIGLLAILSMTVSANALAPEEEYEQYVRNLEDVRSFAHRSLRESQDPMRIARASQLVMMTRDRSAVDDLLPWITTPVAFPDKRVEGLSPWGIYPAQEALIAIGTPAVPRVLEFLKSTEAYDVRLASLDVLYSIALRDPFREVPATQTVRGLLDRERQKAIKPDEQARLAAVLELLDDIQERYEPVREPAVLRRIGHEMDEEALRYKVWILRTVGGYAGDSLAVVWLRKASREEQDPKRRARFERALAECAEQVRAGYVPPPKDQRSGTK